MKKGTKKFLTICAVVIGAGIIIALAGYFTGGIDAISKMSERYSWIKGPAGEREYVYLEEGKTFDAIEVIGDIDVNISGNGGDSETRIGYGENEKKPDMYVKDGVLVINANTKSGSGINLGFGSGNEIPVAEIQCPDRLKYIKGEIDYGDVGMEKLTCDDVDLTVDYGDIEMYEVDFGYAKVDTSCADVSGSGISSGGFELTSDMGDCSLDGTFTGNTNITVDSGDVNIFTTEPEDRYSVSADIDMGNLSIGQNSFDDYSNHYYHGEGDDVIKIKIDMGDADISFGKGSNS